jgi:carbamoyltransferase
MPLGAALGHWHFITGNSKIPRSNAEAMYSRRHYEHKIEDAFDQFRGKIRVRQSSDDIGESVSLIEAGKVIGWFQGASEIGPRALGNRSILADPRNPEMRDRLNRSIKRREMFRPFAPAILAEMAEKYFGVGESPFMLRIAKLLKPGLPAVSHVDGSARFQSVAAPDNPRFYSLIERFFERTGVPLLLNTSFNDKGEPIVETPHDAIKCMLQCGLDALVFPGCVVEASANQPAPVD